MSQYPKDVLRGWVVVIIDDEDDSLAVAQYLLNFHGAIVHEGHDGEEGLALIRKTRPRFVISDLSMPVMDGWELIRELKRDVATRDIPVIALTAHAMYGDRERAIAAGFHNYLTKPLTPITFIGDLMRLLLDIPELALALEQPKED